MNKKSTITLSLTRTIPPRLNPDQTFMLAAQQHQQGNLQAAEQMLRQLLQAQPQHARALHLLGIIASQAGHDKDAIELISRAVAANGKVALFHTHLCLLCRNAGRTAEAIAHGEQAVALDPKSAEAYSNLGLAYQANGEENRNEDCQLRALQLLPSLPTALYNMSNIMEARKQSEKAADYLRQALAANPNFEEALANLGGLLVKLNKPQEALEVLERAMKLNPGNSLALNNMASACNALEAYDAALRLANKALQLSPGFPDALINLAQAHFGLDNMGAAEEIAQHVLKLDCEQKSKALNLLGALYMERDETARALDYFEQASKLAPESAKAWLGMADTSMTEGNFDQAAQYYNKARILSHNELAALCGLLNIKKVQPGNENMAALLALNEQASTLPEYQLRTLHATLGKCYDDLGQAELAFPHFQEACHLKRKQLDYDPVAQHREFDRVIETFDRDTLARLRVGGVASDLPIFVLGMPRSGTTLTEQIIASHPDVFGAGELNDITLISRSATSSGDSFPDNIRGLTPELVNTWAEDYLAGLQKRAPDARRITDKMPNNFLYVGLIHALLPSAKIIHVSRNPVDNCLSCFTKQFSRDNMPHTYDLAELGKYYVDYTRLMAHWRKVLPAGAFLDVKYEELVADNEAQARRLIAYCGLEWNEACLRSHETKRSVRTASVTQVRQPIYNTSVERWRKYEAFLKPLLDELGDLV